MNNWIKEEGLEGSSEAVCTTTESHIVEENACMKPTSNKAVSVETVKKVMGVSWDRVKDSFMFDLATFPKQTLDKSLTKQKLLSTTARFYGPLG